MKIGDKIVCFTDIHFGLKNNERRHNDECERFIKWMIKEAHEFGAEVSIFLGDWHHQRSSVQTSTLNYSNSSFKLLDENFRRHYQIVGNHDLFYKDKREIHSVEFAKNFSNIVIVNEVLKLNDIVLCPWLLNDETKKVAKLQHPYIFGHFELPFFLMNALVAMPDVGHLSRDDFAANNQTVFSGHFHKRQIQKNIHGNDIIYMGNCFPHNFSDVDDDDRGIMLLELGKPPIYKSWPKAPRYKSLLLSQLIEDPSKYIDERTTAKVTIDLDISYEEASFIKETMIQEYKIRELKLIQNKNSVKMEVDTDGIVFNTIDEIVSQCIDSIESTNLDKNLLLDIYNNI